MANVFGNAITDETLKAMPEFQGKEITLQGKARVALKMKHSEDKDVKVRQQVEKLKEKATGVGAATVCLIYNATGDTLTLVTYKDWSGNIEFTPYPPLIENGQWGVFLHVGDVDSIGAVVYRGKNKDGQDRDWMQAWTNPNKAYSEIREVRHWELNVNATWSIVNQKMGESGLMHSEISEGGNSIVVIAEAPTSIFEAVLKHPN